MKRVVSAVLLVVLLTSMLCSAFKIMPAEAAGTICIRADGSIDPPTAPIVSFDNITYTLAGSINDSIVVERDSIVVDGNGYTISAYATGIDLTARVNVTIKNTKIMCVSSYSIGICLNSTSHVAIIENGISETQDGVFAENSSNNTIVGNNITNNGYGIRLETSFNNSISGNNIATNNNVGIYLYGSSYNGISGNNITANHNAGIYFHVSDNYNSISGNNIAGNNSGYGIFLSGSNDAISGNNITNNGDGINLGDSSNTTIVGNNIKDNNAGIYLFYSSNYTSIVGNNITNNGYGIRLYGPYSTVSGNNITANIYDGINLGDSSNTTIVGNNIKDNSGYGIYLYGSGNTVSGNDVTGNSQDGVYVTGFKSNIVGNNIIGNSQQGIYLYGSGNTVSGNNVAANKIDGVYLSGSGNTISGNNITGNSQRGISLFSSDNTISGNNINDNSQYGIYLSGSNNNSISENNIKNSGAGVYLTWCSNNRFWHNNFVNNTHQASSDTCSSDNSWDDGYPSGGNHWSDYTGVDENSGSNQDLSGSDGVGDTPYIIDGNNRDRYPLANPWTPPEHDLAVSITAPVNLQLGNSILLNATVTNEGLNDEVNVELRLLVNGTITNSTIIPLLQPGDSYTLSCMWTPTVKGRYNVTAYAPPLLDETPVENNKKIEFVAVSAPPQIGVETGDWIKCTYAISGWPSGTPHPDWLKVEFLSVEGTNAAVRVTMHMSDETEQNATVSVDVVAGGQALGLSGLVIPANLTTGDVVYVSGYANVTIAGETTNSYAGASRTVVHASFSQYGTQLTYYWDKLTGVILEASTTSGTMTATGKVTETNMWQAAPGLPIDQTILVAVIAIVIVIVAALFLMRRRKKPIEAMKPETDRPE